MVQDHADAGAANLSDIGDYIKSKQELRCMNRTSPVPRQASVMRSTGYPLSNNDRAIAVMKAMAIIKSKATSNDSIPAAVFIAVGNPR